MARQSPENESQLPPTGDRAAKETTLALAEEQVNVGKREVVDGRVTVTRKTSEREQLIEAMLSQQQVDIQRVTKGESVSAIPDMREENGVLIIPVVDEQIEVIRTLVLREEIHIRKVTTTMPFKESVTLRSQEVVVTRQQDDE